MSFDSRSELPPHLLALANLTQWHANTANQPLDLRCDVTGKTIGTLATAVPGAPGVNPPAGYTQSVTVAVYELAQAGHFDGAFTLRITASPGGQAIIKQIPLTTRADQKPEETTPAQPAAPVSNNGLQLRSALLARGHRLGFSAHEIAAEEKQRGFTFTPELKFYRALVKEGTVAERGGRQVLASTPQADFGASALDSLPWRAPQTTDGTVQAVLSHPLWIEIAHDTENLYAIDLAPGAAGTPGQIITRRRGEASVPVRVALSLAQFVNGQLADGQDAAEPAPDEEARGGGEAEKNPLDQTVVWAGTVEPLALPGVLGWTLAPSQKRYENVMGLIAPAQPRVAGQGALQSSAAEDAGVPGVGAPGQTAPATKPEKGTPLDSAPLPNPAPQAKPEAGSAPLAQTSASTNEDAATGATSPGTSETPETFEAPSGAPATAPAPTAAPSATVSQAPGVLPGSARGGAHTAQPAPGTASVFQPATGQRASTLFTSAGSAEESVAARPMPESTGSQLPPAAAAELADGAASSPAPAAPVAAPTPSSPAQGPADPPVAEEDEIDVIPTKAPVSKEQQEIASSIATLAFGTKEERREFAPPETGPVPTIASRAKKVSLTDPAERARFEREEAEKTGLRATLRKFFLG